MRGWAEAGRPEDPRMYTMREVAAILKVSESTVYGITKRGELAYIKFDRNKRILDSDLREYMQRNRICHKREEG
jgi:excisionase family DNA binding protein